MTAPHGKLVVLVCCGHCGATTTRLQNFGGSELAYCGVTCRNGAKRARQRRGETGQPQAVKPQIPCPGCGEVVKLGRRLGVLACGSCRSRLHGACARKIAFESPAGAEAYGRHIDVVAYQCQFCLLWHLTSPGTANELPGDTELGQRLRAAGYARTVLPEHRLVEVES